MVLSNSINRVEREIRSCMEDKAGVVSGWGWDTLIIYKQVLCNTALCGSPLAYEPKKRSIKCAFICLRGTCCAEQHLS